MSDLLVLMLVFQPRCGRWQNARVSASLRLFHPRKLRNNLPVIFSLDDLQFSIEALADNVQYSQPTRVTIHGIQSVLGVISTPNNALFAFTGSWHLSKLDSLPSKVRQEWKVDFCRELNGYTYAFAATFAFASIMIALPFWSAILQTCSKRDSCCRCCYAIKLFRHSLKNIITRCNEQLNETEWEEFFVHATIPL